MSVVGPIQDVSINGRTFAVAEDADVSRNLGGRQNTLLRNGNGTVRVQQNNVAWSLSGLQLAVDDDAGDHEFLQNIANSGNLVPMNITYASGVVYGGQGTITDEMTYSSASGTASVTLSGQGQLAKQS